MWGFGPSGSDQWGHMDNAKEVKTPNVSGTYICLASFYVCLNTII